MATTARKAKMIAPVLTTAESKKTFFARYVSKNVQKVIGNAIQQSWYNVRPSPPPTSEW